MRIQTVVFDVSETLVSDGRMFASWADWMGVQRHVFFAVLGAVIAAGGRERDAFDRLRPGFDMVAERERRAGAGAAAEYGPQDLYPDAGTCLAALSDQGVAVGVAGERPVPAVRSLGLRVDLVASACDWGVERSSPWFFARLVIEAACRAGEILYVGSRAGDLRAAREAGLVTAFLRRGPWGYVQDGEPELRHCRFRLAALDALPALVTEHNTADPA